MTDYFIQISKQVRRTLKATWVSTVFYGCSIWLRAQAQMIAAEIVTIAFICKNYLIPLEESILYVVAGLMVMNFSLLASFP